MKERRKQTTKTETNTQASKQGKKSFHISQGRQHRAVCIGVVRRSEVSRSHRPDCTQTQSSIFSPQATRTTVAALATEWAVRKAVRVRNHRNKGILCVNDEILWKKSIPRLLAL